MSRMGPVLVALGIFIGGLGILDHVLLGIAISHLATYLVIAGLIVLGIGTWITFRGRRSATN
jgi:hypothetical protein